MEKRKVIELIRVSTAGQAAEDRASIPAQRAVNQRTAQTYNLTIIRSIELTDVSGASVLLSPEIQNLMQTIADPQIIGVVTREFSRLMRPENFADFGLLQRFVDTNTLLFLPEGPIDFASKTGRLFGTLRAAIAGMERTEIIERIWNAKEAKRRAGGFAQARICLPYGVDFNDGRWFYKPDSENVREAFRLLLSGILSYTEIGRRVGIEPFNLRLILRNPIYTGWRFIDKKRDNSPGAKRTKKDGRQGDRRKISRTPEEVIRIKVIETPLVSENDFAKAQELMNLKRQRHWKTKTGYEHRFVYNGFLICSNCGRIVYTGHCGTDYYVCKGKRLSGEKCQSRYMRRDILDKALDSMIANQFTDRDFLYNLVKACMDKGARVDEDMSRARARLGFQQNSLRVKRQRVVDSFIDGVIDRLERDKRLSVIDSELSKVSGTLLREPPRPITAESIAIALEPFLGWATLGREEKRRILRATGTEIKVADYRIEDLSVIPRSNILSPTDKDSSQLRA